MKIGYPCVNYTVGYHGNRTFRLKAYSDKYLIKTVDSNLSNLLRILQFNVDRQIHLFRISSDIIPFASHPVCTLDWAKYFEPRFKEIGSFINQHQIRISVYPDKFSLMNTENESMFKRSLAELQYYMRLMEMLELDMTARIQMHVGNLGHDNKSGIQRFIRRYHQLDESLRSRLVIHNDDPELSLRDCLRIYESTGLPVVFDYFSYSQVYGEELLVPVMQTVQKTWPDEYGRMIVIYSQQESGEVQGTRATTLEEGILGDFLRACSAINFDLMLDFEDKESSAVRAVSIASEDQRFFRSEINFNKSTKSPAISV